MQGEVSLTFAIDHPAFAGHFPGRPIVPGVLLIDAVLHAVAQAGQSAGENCQIASAKFLSPVLPGETLTISYTTTTTTDKGHTRFDISGKGRQVATGTFVCGTAP